MKKIILIILATLLLSACDFINCCTVVSTRIEIRYIDSDVNNILGVKDALDTADLKIYYKRDDTWIAYYKEKLK